MEFKLKIETPINILLQRTGAIGDVIMTTGVVRELKNRYPDSNIDVATDCIEVYKNNPRVRNILTVDMLRTLREPYQLYINLDDAYEANPLNHYVDSYFYRALGKTTLNQSVELFPNDADKTHVAEFQQANDLTKYIVIHMRRWNWECKNISPEVWYSVFERLFTTRTDFKIVCVGGHSDLTVDHPLFVDARQHFNSQELKQLCDDACCFVGVDSGPLQCAAASKTHIVALLTHLLPERILPHRNLEIGKNCTAVQTLEDCAGCNDRQARPIRQVVCEKGTYPCRDNFDTDAIATAILTVL